MKKSNKKNKFNFTLNKGTYGKLIIAICILYLFISNIYGVRSISRVSSDIGVIMKDLLISSNTIVGVELVALMIKKVFPDRKSKTTKGNENNEI
jgi:hypothetical protein